MPYCCNCGQKIANVVHNETGTHSKVEAFLCHECDWHKYCEKEEHDNSFCSVCGDYLPTYKEFEQHHIKHK